MKLTFMIKAVLVGMALTACSTQRDPAADVKKICDCFAQGKDDSRKFMECSTENEKLRKNYLDDNDALTRYDQLLLECMTE